MPTQTLRSSPESICVEVERPRSRAALGIASLWDAADSARSCFSMLKEMVALRLGPGRLSLDDYVELRLYDKDIFGAADKEAFVGLKASQKIWLGANYRLDAFGLVNNKLACDMLFAAHGFPIMPTLAIFRSQVGRQAPFLLRSDEELRGFLTRSEHYPLFGKPVNGRRSIGTSSIDRYDAESGCLLTTAGQGVLLETFVAYIKAHGASGYLLQKRVSPHTAIREICGERLATVRLSTIVTKGEPRLIRA